MMVSKYIVSSFFILGGMTFFLLTLFKYTMQEHLKEKEKWEKRRSTRIENNLFAKGMSRSFYLTKALLLLVGMLIFAFGVVLFVV
ncbi:hypothetical protein LC040_02860 [Bacillus tianshenii]|nr:hypothetical protein LC040_02860 [Bacillus tianshenii]